MRRVQAVKRESDDVSGVDGEGSGNNERGGGREGAEREKKDRERKECYAQKEALKNV